MKLYSVWCEWDIGQDGYVFKTKERAKEYMIEYLKRCGIEEDFNDLYDEGLIGFEKKELVE